MEKEKELLYYIIFVIVVVGIFLMQSSISTGSIIKGAVNNEIYNLWEDNNNTINPKGNKSVNSSYFCLSDDCINSWSFVGNNTYVAANGSYLYNSSTLITFNETKLNLTIDARSGGGGGSPSLIAKNPNLRNDSIFIYLNETKTNETYVNVDGDTITGNLVINADTSTYNINATSYNYNNIDFDSAALSSLSTGILTGGEITISENRSKFNVESGSAWFVDSADPNNPIATFVSWDNISNTTAIYVNSIDESHVYIDSSGSIVQQTSDHENEDRRSKVHLGDLIHPSANNNITVVRNFQIANNIQPANLLYDLAVAIGNINVDGNVYSGVSGSMNISRSSGSAYIPGSNFINNPLDPDVIHSLAENPDTFRQSYRDGIGGFNLTPAGQTLDCSQYDDGSGTLSTLLNNKWQILRATLFPTNDFTVIEYGQTVYGSKSDAEAAVQTGAVDVNPILGDGVFRSWIVCRGGATDTGDSNDVVFIASGKFGGTAGTVGLSAAEQVDLQDAYDNSLSGDIVLDADKDIIFDAYTIPHTLTDGVFHMDVLAGADNIKGFKLSFDTNSYGGGEAMQLDYIGRGISDEKFGEVLALEINTADSTGGEIGGLRIDEFGLGTAEVYGINIGAVVHPILHHSGDFIPLNTIYSASPTNVFTNLTTNSTNASRVHLIFDDINSRIYLGHTEKFSQVEFLFNGTTSTSILPKFYHSNAGFENFTEFFPLDQTDGMIQSGVVDWETDFLIDWVPGDVNDTTGLYWIMINATADTVGGNSTFIEGAVTTEYYWKKEGNLFIYNISDSQGDLRTAINTVNSSLQVLDTREAANNATQATEIDSIQSDVLANNASVVHLAGTETITGNKTFTGETIFDNDVFFRGNQTVFTNPAAMIVNESTIWKDITGAIQAVVNASGDSYFNGGGLGVGTSSVTTNRKMTIDGDGLNVGLNIISSDQFSGIELTDSGGSVQIYSSLGDVYIPDDVGIGTASPTATLHVVNTGSSDSFRVDDVASDTSPFIIDNSGNVGIGDSTPSYSLEVNGDVNIVDTLEMTTAGEATTDVNGEDTVTIGVTMPNTGYTVQITPLDSTDNAVSSYSNPQCVYYDKTTTTFKVRCLKYEVDYDDWQGTFSWLVIDT